MTTPKITTAVHELISLVNNLNPQCLSLGAGTMAQLQHLAALATKQQKETERHKHETLHRLRLLQDDNDTEAAHLQADNLLCDRLRQHGDSQIVSAWEEVERWYS